MKTTAAQGRPAPFQWARLIAQERAAGFLLAFVAGFVDIVSYLGLHGLFSANITGDVLLAAAALVEPGGAGVASRVASVPIFVAGVALGWLLAAGARRWGWPCPQVVLLGEVGALLVFAAMGLRYGPQLTGPEQQGLVLLIGLWALLAMGIQNALARELFAALPATTGMTTNITLAVLDGAELARAWLQPRPGAGHAPQGQRLARTVAVLAGFALGAMAGAYGLQTLGYWSVAVPITVLALLLPTAHRPALA